MSRALINVRNDRDRNDAAKLLAKAPPGTSVEFRFSDRTPDQNKKLWACLTDVARQVEWYGTKLTADDWKDVFTASLRKARVVPGIDNGTFVPLGMRTSTMSKAEFSDLLELIHAFGAERGVVFHDDLSREAGRMVA